MKINFKKLFTIIILTILIGSIFSFFIGTDIYTKINRPFLSPPGIVFPIVWTVLYALMGISLYMVLESSNINKDSAFTIYIIQLIVNSSWTLIFFGLNNFLLGVFWIIFLIILVITMIITFYRINKLSGLLQIPYLIWLCFALYLNTMIYFLN